MCDFAIQEIYDNVLICAFYSDEDNIKPVLQKHGVDEETVHILCWENLMTEASLSAVTPALLDSFGLTQTQMTMLKLAVIDCKERYNRIINILLIIETL